MPSFLLQCYYKYNIENLLGVLIRRIVKCNDHCYFNWLSAWLSAKVPN